jgi:hypothetical protein
MAETLENPQPSQAGQTASASPRPIPLSALVLIGSPLTAVTVAFLSKDWLCTTVGCTILTAILIAVWDRCLLAPVVRKGHCQRWVQLLPALIILGLLAAFFVRSPTRIFRQVFGVPPPPGIHDLALDSAVSGQGGGEQEILMRFKADQKTIDQLLQHRGFVVDQDTMKTWSDRTGRQWIWLWRRAFSNITDFGGRPWKDVQPMSDPVLYIWGDSIRHESVRLLWDRVSGRAYVLVFR